MNDRDYCLENDLLCSIETDADKWEVWSGSCIDFVTIASRIQWRNMMRRKLQLELRMSLR